MYKGVHFCAYTVDVEVGDGEDVVFDHEGFGVRLRWAVQDDTYYFFLCFYEGLEVCFCGVGAPYGDGVDEVGVDEGVV